MDKKCKNHDSLTTFTQKYNQEMKRLIDVHTNLASEIKKKLEKEDYQQCLELEKKIITGKKADIKDVIE